MVHCSIKGCKSDSAREEENVSFHRFPSDPKVRESWAIATGRPDLTPTKELRVCSKHFEARCFNKTSNLITLLRSGSVPTIFGKKKSARKKACKNVVDDLVADSDSSLVKKLKADLSLLRIKSKEDGIKIKCLQSKIRRLLRKQNNTKGKTTGYLIHRSQAIDDDSSDSADSLPSSPSEEFIDKINFEEDIDESSRFGYATSIKIDPDEVPIDYVDENHKIKIEDDPLSMST